MGLTTQGRAAVVTCHSQTFNLTNAVVTSSGPLIIIHDGGETTQVEIPALVLSSAKLVTEGNIPSPRRPSLSIPHMTVAGNHGKERERERAGQTFLSCHLNPSPRVALLCGRDPADCRPLSSAEASMRRSDRRRENLHADPHLNWSPAPTHPPPFSLLAVRGPS